MAHCELVVQFTKSAEAYPKPVDFNPSYGTAGFRAEASSLSSTLFRCGGLIAARSIVTGQACGIMITASHNADCDNGVKLVEPSGDMLNMMWEPVATELAQAGSQEQLQQAMSAALARAPTSNVQPVVLLAYDTRPSAKTLAAAAKSGASSLGAKVLDLGQLITPQLHWMVKTYNLNQPITLEAYYSTLLDNFSILTQAYPQLTTSVTVDCANGVGAQHIHAIQAPLQALGVQVVTRNTGEGRLNHQCGADYVEKAKKLPDTFDGQELAGSRCCSMDGDADRLVYFVPVSEPGISLRVVDGDMIASLAATLVQELVEQLPADAAADIKVGMVQTAYANGASTRYMRDVLGAAVVRTATGVKHLHHAAVQYDIGVYWEANGHGTILFKAELLDKLDQVQGNTGARELLALSRMVNQTTGDALSNILLVEAILRRKGWSIQDAASIYQQLPSCQVKVTVKDRTTITTTNAETTCVTPTSLQPAVDEAVAKYPMGRAFVRPSGTEDVVRVYAEAATVEAVAQLAEEVTRLTYDLAGGVGPRP